MSLVKKGDLFTLLGWQRQLPPELMQRQPEVRLAIAWGLALAMRFEEALELLHELEPNIEAGPSDGGVLACECQAIRSVAIALKDDSQTGCISPRTASSGQEILGLRTLPPTFFGTAT